MLKFLYNGLNIFLNRSIKYRKDEMVSTTEILKNFAKTIERVAAHQVEKIAIMKNNKPAAILISVDEYERLQWNSLDKKEYLQQAYEELKNLDTKWYTPEEADEALEKTIAKYKSHMGGE